MILGTSLSDSMSFVFTLQIRYSHVSWHTKCLLQQYPEVSTETRQQTVHFIYLNHSTIPTFVTKQHVRRIIMSIIGPTDMLAV